ncbi:MAG: hypothetical protein ACR2PL_07670 [Dehalococcoidia bacterium]
MQPNRDVQRSAHVTDVLIRDLIPTGNAPEVTEVGQILRRLVSVPFPSIREHLAQRIRDEQWSAATTEQEYLGDLRRAIEDSRIHLSVYKRRGGAIAAVLTETQRIVPEERRGAKWEPLLFIAYSADRGIIVTGYQAGALGEIRIPGDAQWFR